ncbi:unnamed protein product, partial [Mesorhabditis spiculigera]
NMDENPISPKLAEIAAIPGQLDRRVDQGCYVQGDDYDYLDPERPAFFDRSSFRFFVKIPQMIALSTPIMGLKGNLDMTFASRLATMSHQGKLDTWDGIKKRVPINMMLVQAQAMVISFFATALTLALSAIQNAVGVAGAPSMDSIGVHIPLMIATGLMTICTSCGVMDTVMATMVIVSRRKNVNPDNITAPIAASMGDLACMCLLVAYGSLLFIPYSNDSSWRMIPSIVLAIVIMCTWPYWMYKCLQDEKCRTMLKTSWFSLIGSAMFSACGGFILQICVNSFPEMSLYQPLMAGIAGNRVAVQSSRIASLLYRDHKPGELPEGRSLWHYLSPWRCYLSKDTDAGAARLLLATAVPFQAIFVSLTYLVSYILHKSGVIDPLPMINWQFTLGYLIAAFVQILILLWCCQLIVFAMWRFKMDPDLHAIPILTGMGDLFGTTWAAVTYVILYQLTPSSIRTTFDPNGLSPPWSPEPSYPEPEAEIDNVENEESVEGPGQHLTCAESSKTFICENEEIIVAGSEQVTDAGNEETIQANEASINAENQEIVEAEGKHLTCAGSEGTISCDRQQELRQAPVLCPKAFGTIDEPDGSKKKGWTSIRWKELLRDLCTDEDDDTENGPDWIRRFDDVIPWRTPGDEAANERLFGNRRQLHRLLEECVYDDLSDPQKAATVNFIRGGGRFLLFDEGGLGKSMVGAGDNEARIIFGQKLPALGGVRDGSEERRQAPQEAVVTWDESQHVKNWKSDRTKNSRNLVANAERVICISSFLCNVLQ